MYFDAANGNPGAIDYSLTVSIFSKRTNIRIMDVVLQRINISRVEYFQPDCSTGEVVTDRIFYTKDFILDPEIFNDAMGYYIVWQRCCRNYSIPNINSEPPEGRTAGQTFYLEIPPVVDEDGNPFINSSSPNRAYWGAKFIQVQKEISNGTETGNRLVSTIILLSTQMMSTRERLVWYTNRSSSINSFAIANTINFEDLFRKLCLEPKTETQS